MCPVCLATAAIVAASTTGTGGLAALVVRTIRGKARENPFPGIANKEDQVGNDFDSSSSPQDGLPR
jgi:hypothetical protein